ncbi:MAG: polyisoprenoid-binding protein [Bacteroidia bacterium]|nr:MAG: polyisoprenoid-binding protein [Bacteroidia bacterium]
MKKLILTIMTTASIATQAQVKWKLDNAHSKVGFTVTHMMISETEGYFKIYGGEVQSKSETDFTNATITFTADVNSINTDNEQRDGHLKSPEFFDAAKYPTISFKSTSMKPTKNPNEYELVGELTIKGVTKKVTLKAIGSGKTVKDPWGNIRYGFKVTGVIKRSDFGLTWNAALETGGVVVSDEVNINCKVELIKEK